MDRRNFIAGLAALIGAICVVADAQPVTPRRIGFLGNGSSSSNSRQLEAFRRGLRDLGWVEGRSLVLEYRWADGNPDRLPALADELVQAKVDALLVSGAPAIRAAQSATRSVPIVFVVLTDPVMLGLVSSLARPGGNMTGVASQFEELITKQLQLLKEAVPNLSRVALLHRPDSPPQVLQAAQVAARSLGLAAQSLSVAGAADFENAFKLARSDQAGAMHVLPSPFFDTQHNVLIALAARYQLPACYEFKNYVQDGGLMSYGPSINDMYERSARYVDSILKGASPADLPIERPTRFELVINLKTAIALGLRIPQSLLHRADEVIS